MLDYPERLRKLLLTPQRAVHVELNNMRDDNGEIAMFDAYRVLHDGSLPFKGGFRFHPNVSMDNVRRHAFAIFQSPFDRYEL